MRKYILGTGLVLIAVHNPNQPFLQYAFLPWIGLILIISAVVSLPFSKISLGRKRIWIPLLLVCASISLSGLVQLFKGAGLAASLAPAASAVAWFGVYLVARHEGEGIGKPIAIAVIIESVSLVVSAFVTGQRGGGLLSPTNYDIAAGFLILGTFLSPKSWQWWLSCIAIVGVFFSGAEEGIIGVAAVGLIMILVKDYTLKSSLVASTLILAVVVATPLGITEKLYLRQGVVMDGENPSLLEKIQSAQSAFQSPDFNHYMDIATGYRWQTHWRISPIQPFGYGYNLTNFYWGIPHNIFLIIIEQVGILGLIGWCLATFFSIKSKRYYLWAVVLGLGMFDHYIWTQIAPWWWAMVGLSEGYPYKSANVFKGV